MPYTRIGIALLVLSLGCTVNDERTPAPVATEAPVDEVKYWRGTIAELTRPPDPARVKTAMGAMDEARGLAPVERPAVDCPIAVEMLTTAAPNPRTHFAQMGLATVNRGDRPIVALDLGLQVYDALGDMLAGDLQVKSAAVELRPGAFAVGVLEVQDSVLGRSIHERLRDHDPKRLALRIIRCRVVFAE